MKHSIINYFQSFSSIRELKLSRRTAIPLYLVLGGLYLLCLNLFLLMPHGVLYITDFFGIIIPFALIVVFLLVCRMRDAHLPWYLILLLFPVFFVSFNFAYLISCGLMFFDSRPQNTEHNISKQKDTNPRLLHRLAMLCFLPPLAIWFFVYYTLAIAHLGIFILDCQVSPEVFTIVSDCKGAEVWGTIVNFFVIVSIFVPLIIPIIFIVFLGGVTLGIILKLLAFRDAKHKDYQSSKRDV